MKLGVFLSLGESFADLKRQGQDQLMIDQNIAAFSRHFDQVYVFTYEQESVKLPQNCYLIQPPFKIHRYIYALVLPLIHFSIVSQLDVLRCFQLSGTLPAIVAKIFLGKKFVYNLGYDYASFAAIEGRQIQAGLYSWLNILASNMADHILVKNKLLLRLLPKHARSKATFNPNGVNTKIFRPSRVESHPITTLLFVGRLEAQKNLLNLVQAMSLLKTPAALKLVGQGSLKRKIMSQAKKYHVNIKLLGPVSHRQLAKIYQQADIFVLPSLKEGSPKVLLEAMASGLACIASDIPEHRQIITSGKNGMLSAPSAESLAQAINKLLKLPHQRMNLGREARSHMQRHFDIDSLLTQEINLLQTL